MLFGVSTSSHAQNVPTGEFSAGWRLLTLPDVPNSGSQTFPLGWYVDVAGNLTRTFAVVGEVGGNYKDIEENSTQVGTTFNVDVNFDVHTFMGGVRFNARQNPAFTPYVQALFGLAHGTGHVKAQMTTPAGSTFTVIDQSVSDSNFAFDADGGVNVRVSDALAVRVGAGYLRVGGGDGGNAFRFGAGVVIPF
jgi:Outer membrane protein beta-barrel domain